MIRFPISPNVAADLVPLFREGLRRSQVKEGETAIIYADTLTNPQYPAAFLAAAKDLGAEAFQIIQPAVPHVLSKGMGRAMPTRLMVEAMKGADFVLDITTGGMLYSNEQNDILAAGTRILRVREPDDCLIRLLPNEEVRARTIRGGERLRQAKRIRITSEDGTDLTMSKADRPVSIQYGMADKPGRWDHWPTGLITTHGGRGDGRGHARRRRRQHPVPVRALRHGAHHHRVRQRRGLVDRGRPRSDHAARSVCHAEQPELPAPRPCRLGNRSSRPLGHSGLARSGWRRRRRAALDLRRRAARSGREPRPRRAQRRAVASRHRAAARAPRARRT